MGIDETQGFGDITPYHLFSHLCETVILKATVSSLPLLSLVLQVPMATQTRPRPELSPGSPKTRAKVCAEQLARTALRFLASSCPPEVYPASRDLPGVHSFPPLPLIQAQDPGIFFCPASASPLASSPTYFYAQSPKPSVIRASSLVFVWIFRKRKGSIFGKA